MTGFRAVVFTHDTFGLGHIRRSLHFVREMARRSPDAAILLITGSPVTRMFDALPPHVDVLKIPTIVKTGSVKLRPPHLPIPLEQMTRMRSRLIRDAVTSFAPDVFLVDNFPLGSRRELLPVLRELHDLPTRTVLGLRDILDAPEIVREDWERQGIYDVIQDLYDRVLIYGTPDILDVVSAYNIPAVTASRFHYCGYVTQTRESSELPVVEPELGRFLLATGGGGGDGFPLLKTFAEAMALLPDEPAIIFTGPLMNRTQQEEIRDTVKENPHVEVRDFVPDLRGYLARADVVVSMCGYNTAAEIVAQGARAIVVPRTWRYGEHEKGNAAGVEWEQRMRAESLSRLGLVDFLDPEDLSAENLARRIAVVRRQGTRKPAASLNLDGIANVTDHLIQLATQQKERKGDAA